MQEYLAYSRYIDHQHPAVLAKAQLLADELVTDSDIAKACFEFVRDEIKHSNDYKLNPVTCKASDVLEHSTGYCYAKSHLLAALLRANGIPAGLCYQRLSIDDEKPPFCLHGLNAVYLEEFGWYKVDARGNKDSVNAQFTPPIEQLAFPIIIEGEFDLPEIYTEPLPQIIEVLSTHTTYLDVLNNLPDLNILSD